MLVLEAVYLTVPPSLFQGEPGFQGPMGLRGLPGDGLPGEKVQDLAYEWES